MYHISISEDSITTDDLEQLLKSWKPKIQFSYTQLKQRVPDRTTGKFKSQIQKIPVRRSRYAGNKYWIYL